MCDRDFLVATMLKLEFTDNSQASFWVVDEQFTIGSSAKNQLQIEHVGIAPFHAQVSKVDGKLMIEPISPDASVAVNYKAIIDSQPIKIGDTIDLAGVHLRLTDPSARQQQTTPKALTDSMLDTPYGAADTSPKKKNEQVWRVRSMLAGSDEALIDIADVVSVGRDPSNDVVISGSHISRRHAEFFIQNGQLIVRDLDSANGTFVNGDRVRERAIYLGDEIGFDSSMYRVAVGKSPSVANESAIDKTQFRPALDLSQLENERNPNFDGGFDDAFEDELLDPSGGDLELVTNSFADFALKSQKNDVSRVALSEVDLAPVDVDMSNPKQKSNLYLFIFILLVVLFAFATLMLFLWYA